MAEAQVQVQVQGVTTTAKKRGRPAKKQSLDDEGVVLLQQQESKTEAAEMEMVQALKPKSRGRPSSSAATTASKTSSLAASARSGRAKQVPPTAGAGGAAVEEEVVGCVSSGKGSASAKRKPSAPAAGVKTPEAAPSKARKSTAAKVSSSQNDTASSTSTSSLATLTATATATVTGKKTKAKATAKKGETEISSQTTSQQPGTSRLSTSSSTSTSKILGHAKAFSEKSSQLQRDILKLVNEREARHLSSRDIEAEILEMSSHIPSGADTKSPVPAPAPTLETSSTGPRYSIDEASSMLAAANAAPNMNHNTTLTSDAAPVHVFPSQTIASLSQQQHFYPPPSVLSAPIATAQTQHQVRGYSSTKALPMSTTIALAARQQNNPNASGGSRPSMPPRPTIPPEVPNAPKLTELPLEQLKKDPRYRKASTRYTTFVVALPFAIVSSYFLWERCKFFHPSFFP
ncbi:hypothetical protein Z517_02119 [Fonsecaea pedrosoi CBS 271.37]|uniref:Uncharacterized protein n=1 Tax=Fonsecaea pedrosoi CBS 271.37 TaxID=1442368 RepID=A0A0D2DYL7_9EURO|nr:uncharacterized protein Z517_02119 [Fonsecaea pedrosoi CBS 271.37]KIW82876.1 hypothetical protein Z517_02119 [Fonsecaea pedrosoi CBS 271.37]